jgi:probable phosphomutase (TIGR03848 family)
MTILLLIRHATNDYVKDGRLAGWIPGVHLNAQGQREADALARRLDHISIHAIYASPLERAVDTARAVAQCQKLDVQIREELGEVRPGQWAGKAIKELEQTNEWKQMIEHPVGFHLPGGESIDEVQARMVSAVDSIVAGHPDQIVAVVSHADPIKATIAHYIGLDLDRFGRLTIDPASVSVLFFGERGAALYRLNDGDKLPAFKPEKEKTDANDAKGKDKSDA